MTYRDQLQQLGEGTATRAQKVYEQYLAGAMTLDIAIAVLATLIAKANSKAVALADMSLAATLMLQRGEPMHTVGLVRPDGDLDRLTKAATTILDNPGNINAAEASGQTLEDYTRKRVTRLANSEPLAAAGTAYSKAIAENPVVIGYRRNLSPNACELCTWLAKKHLDPEGYVYPADQPMHQHKGCTCTPTPVTKKESA